MAYYTVRELADITSAYAAFRDWAEKHGQEVFVQEALRAEYKQFTIMRSTQARASVLRIAYEAMDNNDHPLFPSKLCMRAALLVVYVRISFAIRGMRNNANQWPDYSREITLLMLTMRKGIRADRAAQVRAQTSREAEIDRLAAEAGIK